MAGLCGGRFAWRNRGSARSASGQLKDAAVSRPSKAGCIVRQEIMKHVECEFEAEVLAAALQSRWPERVDAQLRAHVAGCAVCADVAAIAVAVDAAREDLSASAMVPDSGRV